MVRHLLLTDTNGLAAKVVHFVFGLALLHPSLSKCRVTEEAESEKELDNHQAAPSCGSDEDSDRPFESRPEQARAQRFAIDGVPGAGEHPEDLGTDAHDEDRERDVCDAEATGDKRRLVQENGMLDVSSD